MRSALYCGHVQHDRFTPRTHSFRNAIQLLYLDLDELPRLFRGRWLWSVERWNLVSFHRADYLGDASTPLRTAVLDRVDEELGRRPDGHVGLLTQLRAFGYVFNPVSFYYCHRADGRLDAIVAEITNTPWAERHSYVLDVAGASASRDLDMATFNFDKNFHVSPFFDMNQQYRWRFSGAGERVEISMTNIEEERSVFHAGLSCERQHITGRSLAGALLRYPFQPFRVHAAIYLQAALLYLKRIPFFNHPSKRRSVQDASIR